MGIELNGSASTSVTGGMARDGDGVASLLFEDEAELVGKPVGQMAEGRISRQVSKLPEVRKSCDVNGMDFSGMCYWRMEPEVGVQE